MKPSDWIPLFDRYLKSQEQEFWGVVIGGTALALMGTISRETRDCDLLYPEIPEKIKNSAIAFAKLQQSKGIEVHENWLNNAADGLVTRLPTGWAKRTQIIYQGEALELHVLERSDLLKTKLYAYCSRGLDFEDCLALKPTAQELQEALSWVQSQESQSHWAEHVQSQFEHLSKALNK